MKITDYFTEDDVVRAINRFSRGSFGLCDAFTNAKASPMPIFKALKGKYCVWYWPYPNGRTDENPEKTHNQRATMLAFLLTWVNDPDFEV